MNEMDKRQEWLAALKPGDEVVVVSPGVWGNSNLCVVQRLAATQIIAGNCKFRRMTGWEVGAGTRRLDRATPEVRARLEREALISRIDGIGRAYRNWPLEQLREIWAAYERVGKMVE